jgi:hypothetical protein
MPTGKPDDKELSPISGRLMKTTASRKLDEVVETLTHSMSFIVTKPASNQTALTFVFEIKSVTSLRPETWQPFGVGLDPAALKRRIAKVNAADMEGQILEPYLVGS